ncbi:MAG: deoxyribodipyrimidine photo-lyase [Verrucomicrobia bacterium]|nr:deoxyribodipyrimidine photo-lyase [Verrucomicrobiota bacterium]
MAGSPTILWFRQDLRLQDNPALAAAIERGGAILPVYILDESGEGGWALGGASRWWLHGSLAALDASLRERGLRLILARGESAAVLRELIAQTGADAVFWNRRYEPASIARDSAIKSELGGRGIDVRSFNASLLFEPQTIANKQGRPFQVFTPYWRHCLTLPVNSPVAVRHGPWPAPERWPASLPLAALGLRPSIPWDRGFHGAWTPGEAGARERLAGFLRGPVTDYGETRDRPSVEGVSRLSPHLHFGEIGPRQVWAAAAELGRTRGIFPANAGVAKFLAEVGWREFAHHLVYHFPQTPEQPLRSEFARFPWRADPGGHLLKAWQRGRTGYPIVDAGMRQLWATGWMHNRVRMIVASFLVKHLRLSWTHGARWFWDTLVDADLASNTLGWQWSAGCGADAAPYFRIFAPVLQGEKFDAEGVYVRHWCPELSRVPARFLHQPWTAPETVLTAAGVQLGKSYPRPVVDHAEARAEALRAFQSLRG